MCEHITERNWTKIARWVHTQMAEHVRLYIASISKTLDNENGEAHGSGVYLELMKDRQYLLTCEHVVREGYANGYRITHLPKVGGNYQAFAHPFFSEPFPKDLALTHIDPGSWAQGDRLSLPTSRIATVHDIAQYELLSLCGYPGARSYPSRFGGEAVLYSPLVPYTARETTLPERFDPDIHFALHYEMEQSEPAGEDNAKLPEPFGFSGSPIWDTGFIASSCSKDWTPAQGRLIGIATDWMPETSCIVATKAEKVREFLLENLRIDIAYHHWITRGRPSDQDVDVAYAVQIVQKLS
jgi:hypothetical protein